MLFLLMTVSNIVSECVTIMHAKVSLCQNDICSSKSFQIPSQCTIYRPCFCFFSAVPNRLKYRQNACFRDIVFFFFSLQFQIVLNTVRIHALERLFSKCSLQFQIVLNNIRIHALETLLSSFFLQFKIVLIPSEYMF